MKIMFFASLREALGIDEENWTDLQNVHTAEDVLNKLIARGEPWSTQLSNSQLLVSVNQELVSLDTSVSEGDELAFMPPVTGG